MPNIGVPEALVILVMLAVPIAGIAGVVWIVRRRRGAEQAGIRDLEARVRELERRP